MRTLRTFEDNNMIISNIHSAPSSAQVKTMRTLRTQSVRKNGSQCAKARQQNDLRTLQLLDTQLHIDKSAQSAQIFLYKSPTHSLKRNNRGKKNFLFFPIV